ncbi:MAG: hypothetical protein JRI96_12460 [Deltaproteobacteria bacterium]|nr:hypothetical protein [Deltaproteobacteria bacterium]
MNKRKTLISNFILFILLIGMLAEFSLYVITPICREAEGRREICEIEEIKTDKNDYRPVVFFTDADFPVLASSIHTPYLLIKVFEAEQTGTYLYFSSSLFNHSPPCLFSV